MSCRPKSKLFNYLLRCLALGAVLLSTASCGPISGLAHIVRARIDLDLAENNGAKQHAVYEQVSAREYLQKAKEEYGYSDFVAADDYAKKSSAYAKQARERAEAVSQLPQ